MNIRLKSLIYIAIFVALYAIYYWVVPVVVNVQGRMPAIQKALKSNFGLDIEVQNPELKMGLSPSVWLNADDFKIKDGNSMPLEVKNPKVKIRLLPLIIGKINIAYFSCDEMDAKVKFDKFSRFYIGNYLIMDNSAPIISFKNSKILVNNYNVLLKDEENSKDINVNGD